MHFFPHIPLVVQHSVNVTGHCLSEKRVTQKQTYNELIVRDCLQTYNRCKYDSLQ